MTVDLLSPIINVLTFGMFLRAKAGNEVGELLFKMFFKTFSTEVLLGKATFLRAIFL